MAALLVLAGCAPAPAERSAAPRITHWYGTTEIPATPKRVISLGYTDQDAILALDVVPVAIREFTGQQPSATWPWAQDRLGGQHPQVLPVGEIDLETIAALRPDLIVGISAGLTRDQYDMLSRIAPTVSQPAQYVDHGTPWQEATRMVGAALGRSADAERLVTDLEARFAAARAQYPALAGRTVATARPSSNDGASYFVWGPQDARGRFFAALGMSTPAEFERLAGDQFYATISTEQLGKLDTADLVVVITSSEAERRVFAGLPGYPALRVVREGRVLTIDDRRSAALSFSSVLSLPEMLDTIPAEMAARLGGTPAR